MAESGVGSGLISISSPPARRVATGREAAGCVHHGRRPDHYAKVGRRGRLKGVVQDLLVERFPEPDDVGTKERSAGSAARQASLVRGVHRGQPAALRAACAPGAEEGAVQLERMFTRLQRAVGRVLLGGSQMEPVDVLRDDPRSLALPHQPRDRPVRRVGRARGDALPSHLVPLPDQPRVPAEGLAGGKRFGPMLLPDALGAAKSRNA
jgi:hypothetical protein